jgi:hypothetical protein
LMREIHDFILATGARSSDVLVVVPAHNWIHWWTRMWQSTYPGVPVPTLVSVRDGIRVRGRQAGMLAIEDVDTLEEGLGDDRLETFVLALRGVDPPILATSARIPMNWKNYTTVTTIDSKTDDRTVRHCSHARTHDRGHRRQGSDRRRAVGRYLTGSGSRVGV